MKRLIPPVEILVFYAFLGLVNHFFFPDHPAWHGLDPHPYWAGVLLFGYRYGVGIGLFSGLAAAGLYLGTAWHFLDRYLFEDLSFYIVPALFVIVGALMGIASQRSNRKWSRAKAREEALQGKIRQTEHELSIIKEVNRGLEKRIVTRMATLVTLYEGARQLESVHTEELYPAILEFASKTLEAQEVSLYLKRGDNWYLKSSVGLQEHRQLSSVIGLAEGLIGEAGNTGRVVSIRDRMAEPQKGASQVLGDALIAGPLKAGTDVVGVVAVHKIPFLQFNSSTLSLFNFILNWASRALERAQIFEEMRESEVIDPDYKVYSHSYFRSRVAQEFLRSKTFYLPLSVVLVGVTGLSGAKPAQKRAFLTVLSHFLRKSCRETHVVACHPGSEAPFAIIMVTTSEKQAHEEIRRLEGLYAKFDWPALGGAVPGLELKMSSFRPQDTAVEDMLRRL